MAHVVRVSSDDETGEVIMYEVNKETGEPVVENVATIDHLVRRSPKSKTCRFPRHGHYSKTKKFQKLKASILAGSNLISPHLLLVPTSIFSPALCTFLMMFEIFLHIRCHKKNKKLKDASMYYRSPFHVITSIFCGVCRDSVTACKIGRFQDKRRTRYDYIRGMAI